MLVTRHLARISNYTQNIKQLQFNQALELKRKNHTPENHDELDSIVLALNEMRDLAQLIPEMIFEVDLTGKIIFINQIAHKMSGYSHEDFKKGMTIFDLLIPEQHDLVKENIKKIIHGMSGEHHEYTLKHKNGSIFHVSASSCAIYKEGKCVGIRGILVDITKRKEMELQLKYSALHDDLTGLPNRRLGIEHLSLAIARDKCSMPKRRRYGA